MADQDQELASRNPTSIPISTLCEKCEEMSRNFRLTLDAGEVERSIQDIETGADDGCPVCLIALGNIHDVQSLSSPNYQSLDCFFQFHSERQRYWYFCVRGNLGDHLEHDQRYQCHCTWLQFQSLVGLNLDTLSLAAQYEYSPRTDSESVGELVKYWLHQCTNQHVGCAPPVSSYRPPRLLELRKNGFRVVISSECGLDSSYATLSHCWGSAPDFLKLTSANIEQLRQWNPIDILPQTFQDAALLCCRIGMRYLWIDSLCIIQEEEKSMKDWSLHVNEMRTIYSNGYLNVAAGCGAASSEGMYAVRKPNFIRPAIIDGSDRFGLTNDLYLLAGGDLIPGTSTPLSRRGWAFQERLLSRRIVHFEKNQIYWQCSEATKCEMYPAGLNYWFPGYFPFSLPTKHACPDAEKHWEAYATLVQNYNCLRMTYPNKDKLAAFAGVAQHMVREFNDEYFAGILRSQLPAALLWSSKNYGWNREIEQLSSDAEYRCPSWSWAKIDLSAVKPYTPALYTFVDCKFSTPYIAILNIETTPEDPNHPFGRLKSASIELEGRVLPWTVYERELMDMTDTQFDGKHEADIKPSDLSMLPILARHKYGWPGVTWPDYYTVFCLILHRAGTEHDERYYRVGMSIVFRRYRGDSASEKQFMGLSTIDEIVEADGAWLSGAEEKRLVLI